jgi:hypothetical protein
MSEVFLAAVAADEPAERQEAAIAALWQQADLGRAFHPKDLTALKLHVGEPGTKTFVQPALVLALVRRIAGTGARPFLTDTAVLYKSPRDNAVGHALVAYKHGFRPDRVGAPFVPADGLIGADEVEVAVGGKHYDEVYVATAVAQARSLLVLSHATGHLGTGLGATLKNVGMGCAAKKGKLRMHHGQVPTIDDEACTACGTCAEWCPEEAIAVNTFAVIDTQRCIGCGECIARCRDHAVGHGWDVMGRELQEKVVEYAAGVLRPKAGRAVYVTSAQQVTKDCDCMGLDQAPLLPDIGVLASHDPVALDQAVWDLIQERAGQTLESMSYPTRDARVQLAYAEEMGLGERAVALREISF